MENLIKNSCAEIIEENVQSFGGRLAEFIEKLGMTKKRFANEIKMSPQSISNYCAGTHQPKPKFLEILVHQYGANREWLMSGVGPMFTSQTLPQNTAEAPADYTAQVLELKHELADKDRELAAVERAMGKQQGLIFEAVRLACREQGLTPEQTRAIQWAVMDYEGVLDQGRTVSDDSPSHQSAVGEE